MESGSWPLSYESSTRQGRGRQAYKHPCMARPCKAGIDRGRDPALQGSRRIFRKLRSVPITSAAGRPACSRLRGRGYGQLYSRGSLNMLLIRTCHSEPTRMTLRKIEWHGKIFFSVLQKYLTHVPRSVAGALTVKQRFTCVSCAQSFRHLRRMIPITRSSLAQRIL